MNKRLGLSVVALFAIGAAFDAAARLRAQAPQQSPSPEAIVPDRVIQLFNGRDLSGWQPDVPTKDTTPDAPDSFIVRDGMLVSLGTPRGHLLTESVYRDYRLEVEYRFPGKPGNCGVLVHASRLRALSRMFPQSIEVQMNHTACWRLLVHRGEHRSARDGNAASAQRRVRNTAAAKEMRAGFSISPTTQRSHSVSGIA